MEGRRSHAYGSPACAWHGELGGAAFTVISPTLRHSLDGPGRTVNRSPYRERESNSSPSAANSIAGQREPWHADLQTRSLLAETPSPSSSRPFRCTIRVSLNDPISDRAYRPRAVLHRVIQDGTPDQDDPTPDRLCIGTHCTSFWLTRSGMCDTHQSGAACQTLLKKTSLIFRHGRIRSFRTTINMIGSQNTHQRSKGHGLARWS